MTSLDTPFAAAPRATALRLALPLFALSLFLSALLLFSVQPMFTKMVLPVLGGSPAVWSVALVFFQAVLLAGYAYAHVLVRHLAPRHAVIVHLAVLAIAFAAMPIAMATSLGRPPAEGQIPWIIALFTLSVGLPFFAVSGNAPLLQAWFARTGHAHAADPYFLYGASNLGSFAALLLYPVAIEPLLTLGQQSRLWQGGFVLLAGLVGAAGLVAAGAARGGTANALPAAEAPPLSRRLSWAAYAFVPSALLVAVTAHISTDLAAAPFLWVIPLALFLLTFVLAFRDPPRLSHALMLRLQPILIAALAPSILAGGSKLFFLVNLVGTLATFFVCAMVAHGELFRRRPAAAHLTSFYLWMSIGGVAGGVFASLLAPELFSTVLEYPILLVAALACRPGVFARAGDWRTGAAILALAVAVCAPGWLGLVDLDMAATPALMVAVITLAALAMLSAERPWRLIGFVVAALLVSSTYQPGMGKASATRSFFGVHKVSDSLDGRFRLLRHGTTIHGAQRLDGAAVPEPLVYYYAGGPISQAIAATRAAHGGTLGRVAAVGLGTGSLACRREAGESWTFYEIDPEVVRLARDASQFRFLAACGAGIDIVLGDARLTLADAAPGFDLIVLDAFSSDAIPVHLMTREAMALYASKLAPGGVLVFHISNRHMELGRPLARAAAESGLVTLRKAHKVEEPFEANHYASSIVAVVARDPRDMAGLVESEGWRKLHVDRAEAPWTDDYSNLLGAIWRHYRD